MPDVFTERAHNSFGGNIINSIKGVLFGAILFIASFFVLYWNEGRLDYSQYAQKAIQLGPAVEQSAQGKLISATGAVVSSESVGDEYLRPGKYLAVKRVAEMYAWKQQTKSKTKNNTGGSSDTETTYSYAKEWNEHPWPSKSFKYPDGHENPTMPFGGAENKVKTAALGSYDLSFDQIQTRAEDFAPLVLAPEQVILSNQIKLENSSYLFFGKGAMAEPQVGDLRVSYQTLAPGREYTVFGKLTGQKIEPYLVEKNNSWFYPLIAGTRDAAVKKLSDNYTSALWIWRGVGFAMMWVGLMLLLGPLGALANFFPMLGALTKNMVFFITLPVALALSGAAILVAMVFHNLLVLLALLAVAVVAGVVILRRKK